ncbi:hypothetical protein GCM10027614_04440 [Micromonospora vulcania]
MCGIGGEFRLDGAPPDLAAIERMLPALASRGPDGEGRWQHGPAALVHRRLRIIDLSDAGAQPMVDPELGLALVFNGCIYNYRELRDELTAAGYTFRSTSDTEVILKAYHRWGRPASSGSTGCSPSPWSRWLRTPWCWPATGSASSRSISPRAPAGSASPRPCRRCSPPGTWTPTSTRWRCTTT